MKRLENQLESQNNGRALATSLRSWHKRSLLCMQRGLKPGEKLRYIQRLLGTLPTKVKKMRGKMDMWAKICKRCQINQVEDDVHILSGCMFNKDLITKWHYVVKKVAKELIKSHSNAKISKERSRCSSGTKLLRPDITMVKGDEVRIIEITLPYEKSNKYLVQRRKEQSKKYQQRLQDDELQQVQCTKGEVIPIIIGTLGTITEATNKDALQMTITARTLNILNNHFRRNGFN